MADYIPFEIQTSLIQFRFVSKTWKSLIGSSKFIVDYHVNRTHHTSIIFFVRYFDWKITKQNYVSILDDDTFPHRKFPLTIPMSAKRINQPIIVGISQGLFCFYMREKIVVLWNPSIRNSIDIDVPNMLNDWLYATIIGFGVCCGTIDIKLVKIRYMWNARDINRVHDDIPSQVEVFRLSSGVWRSPLCSNLPSKSIEFTTNPVAIDGFIYWHVYKRIIVAPELQRYNQIISFDMTKEEFTQVDLPHSLEYNDDHGLSISTLRESLVMIRYVFDEFKSNHGVWMMGKGVPNSFKKLFTIRTNIPYLENDNVLGFTKSGKPIIRMRKDHKEDAIIVYEPSSEHVSYIRFLEIQF